MRRIKVGVLTCWCALTASVGGWAERVQTDELWRVIAQYVIITLIALLLMALAYLWRLG